MFHLELRQFPHVARAFNLTREQLDERFAKPWVSGLAVEHEERRWSPDKARMTIFEGPQLRLDEIGMGRGWATVGKTSHEVTETVLAQAQRGARVALLDRDLQGRDPHRRRRRRSRSAEVVELAVAEYPLWRASERLALAEQAVWELLHQGGLTLSGPDGPIEQERWQSIVISWSTWVQTGSDAPVLESTGLSGQSDRSALRRSTSAIRRSRSSV